MGPPTGWHRLRLLRQIGDQLVAGLEQFLLVDDVVAVEDGAALVPGQEPLLVLPPSIVAQAVGHSDSPNLPVPRRPSTQVGGQGQQRPWSTRPFGIGRSLPEEA